MSERGYIYLIYSRRSSTTLKKRWIHDYSMYDSKFFSGFFPMTVTMNDICFMNFCFLPH